MLFQGAPGVGKTALMQECMEAVRCHSTAELPLGRSFHSPRFPEVCRANR